MRWRGVSHVEFAVLDYDDSIAFYDPLFGWLGYSSFSSLNRAMSTRTATSVFNRPVPEGS